MKSKEKRLNDLLLNHGHKGWCDECDRVLTSKYGKCSNCRSFDPRYAKPSIQKNMDIIDVNSIVTNCETNLDKW